MTFRDLVVISTGNLRRMKLRTFLTSAGVLIAIAAFVSMLSFGAGSQENIERQFNKLGLFTTMHVYPKDKSKNSDDSGSTVKLDNEAIERISKIPGVNLIYPYDAFSVEVSLGDTTVKPFAFLVTQNKLLNPIVVSSGLFPWPMKIRTQTKEP